MCVSEPLTNRGKEKPDFLFKITDIDISSFLVGKKMAPAQKGKIKVSLLANTKPVLKVLPIWLCAKSEEE